MFEIILTTHYATRKAALSVQKLNNKHCLLPPHLLYMCFDQIHWRKNGQLSETFEKILSAAFLFNLFVFVILGEVLT